MESVGSKYQAISAPADASLELITLYASIHLNHISAMDGYVTCVVAAGFPCDVAQLSGHCEP